MSRNINPARIQVALVAALARHGIAENVAESVWDDLSTGNDPRPSGIPASFVFRGITLYWPAGREMRPLTGDEFTTINRALSANGNGLLREDDNARVARNAYECLYNRTQMTDLYDPTPVVDTVATVVAEAKAVVQHAAPKSRRPVVTTAQVLEQVAPKSLDDIALLLAGMRS